MTNRIKKLFFVFTAMSVMSISAMAGIIIQPSSLPKAAQDFIQASFPNDPVIYAEQKRKDFKVQLQSGVEIKFFLNGEWKDIKSSRFQPLSQNILPSTALNSIRERYPQANILKIKKEYSSYKISLDNMRKIYISNNGDILGEKF